MSDNVKIMQSKQLLSISSYSNATNHLITVSCSMMIYSICVTFCIGDRSLAYQFKHTIRKIQKFINYRFIYNLTNDYITYRFEIDTKICPFNSDGYVPLIQMVMSL